MAFVIEVFIIERMERVFFTPCVTPAKGNNISDKKETASL
jgi:hypothetical protein